MQIIVTGGAGFIGSNLVDLLVERNYSVLIVDNLSTGKLRNIESHLGDQDCLIEFLNGDLSNRDIFPQIEEWICREFIVVHLAALADIVPSIESPQAYFDSNVRATENLLNWVRNFKEFKLEKFIYAASSSCYGIPSVYPTAEDCVCDPQYPYALTKYLGEQLLVHYGSLYKLPWISLRFFNVYGSRARTNGTYGAVFGVFLAQLLKGNALTVVGDGSQTRDFTHVRDVCSAVLALAESDVVGEVFNVGSGTHVSINRIVDLLGGERITIPKRPGEPQITFADISKIEARTNWQPKISIEEGVSELLNGIEEWKDAPVWTVDSIVDATRSWFDYLGKEQR